MGKTIALRLPRTIELILAGLVLGLITGIPAGTWAGLRPGRSFDRIVSAANAILISVPGFVIGTLFIYLFAQVLRWLPAGTHDPRKFVKPEEAKSALTNAGLTVTAEAGVSYNPLMDIWRIGDDVSVNYMLTAVKG